MSNAATAGKLFIISAPSGSGKSTLVNELRKLVDNLEFSVSFTTRAPRGSEQDGREYHFVQRHEFETMIGRHAFLEHAQVFGNYYGTASEAIDRARAAGKDVILDIDIQGAAQVMERMPNAASIFILPPSPGVLESRLRQRSAAEDNASHRVTPEEVIQSRLNEARHEVNRVWKYSYAVVNDNLDKAVTELRSIVLCERGVCSRDEQRLAKTCRTSRPSARLHSALEEFGINLPQRSGRE